MRARTASSFTSAAFAAALAVLTSGAGCHAQAPDKAASPVKLCPAVMQGEGTQTFPLSGLTIMRNENDAGWKNFQPTSEGGRTVWTLSGGAQVQHRAACEYGDEIIGVPVDAAFRRCWLERGADGVKTWCEP